MQNSARYLSRSFASLIVAIVLASCGVDASDARADGSDDAATAEITVDALRQRLQSGQDQPLIVDVREAGEFKAGHIEGALLAPLGTVVKNLAGVEKDREIVLVCRSGNRSGKAQKQLAARGYTSMKNVKGGMLAWEKSGYPVIRKQ